jgi:NhaA family Na+:H+ antiporter
MIGTKLFKEFFSSEKSGGLILIGCTIVSMLLANSSFAHEYLSFWKIDLAGHSIGHWINDGLMTIFFFLIGLELEREIYKGELSSFREALLPIFAAFGGMLFPSVIYLIFNYGTETQSGAGIPTATDIAFALGILSLLGNRVPTSLKIFLTAFAVIDDLGAVIIIAVFYTNQLIWLNLLISLGVFVLLLVMNLIKVRSLMPYLLGGIIMWYFMLNSGVHATITGVLLAFAIPFGKGEDTSPSSIIQHFLHKPVAFFILPLFALANTAIPLHSGISETVTQNYSLGITLELILGKPAGILLLSFLGVRAGICIFPEDLKWNSVIGVGFLGGIGFTMSIFITLLAFDNETIINNSKLIILISSLIAGTIGFIILKISLKEKVSRES